MAPKIHHSDSVWKPLLRFLQVERESLWIILVHACGVGLLSLTLPVAIQSLVNTVAFGTVLQPIVVLTILVVFFLAASAALKVLQILAAELLQRRIFSRFSLLAASRLPALQPEVHRRVNVQETVNRFFDIFLVQKALSFLLLEGVGLVLQASIGLILLAFYHPFLLAFGMLLLFALAFICVVLGRGAIGTAIEESSAKYAMAAWLEDLARIPLSLSSTRGRDQALVKADAMASIWLTAREGHFRKIFLQTVGTLGLQVLASGVLLGFGGWLVIRKELSLGQLVAAELIVTSVLYSIAKMGKQFEAFYDVVAGLNKLEAILDLPVEDRGGASLEPGTGAISIELRGAALADQPSGRRLKNLHLKCGAGTKILVCGSGGSGKSLLASLLVGASRTDTGEVLIEGQDVRYLDRSSVHDHVKLVQDLELVDGSIEENLSLGMEHPGLAKMTHALESVGLDRIVSALPSGLKTRVNSRGSPLTHSQARRLMLARAILSEPRLLVLDKNSDWLQGPVASLGTEELVRRLFSSLKECTVIILAEPEFATEPVRREFDACYNLVDGELRHG